MKRKMTAPKGKKGPAPKPAMPPMGEGPLGKPAKPGKPARGKKLAEKLEGKAI